MKNNTKEKRTMYIAQVLMKQFDDYDNVTVYLIKPDLLPKEELPMYISDLWAFDGYAAQELFSKKEINELEQFFKNREGEFLIVSETEIPANTTDIFGFCRMNPSFNQCLGTGWIHFDEQIPINRINLSFNLWGYFGIYDEKRIKENSKAN